MLCLRIWWSESASLEAIFLYKPSINGYPMTMETINIYIYIYITIIYNHNHLARDEDGVQHQRLDQLRKLRGIGQRQGRSPAATYDQIPSLEAQVFTELFDVLARSPNSPKIQRGKKICGFSGDLWKFSGIYGSFTFFWMLMGIYGTLMPIYGFVMVIVRWTLREKSWSGWLIVNHKQTIDSKLVLRL